MVEFLSMSLPLLLFVVGIGLTVAEALIPGAHFIVVGIALMVAGLLGLLFAPLAAPLALAGTTLLAGAVAFWVYRRFDFYGGNHKAGPSDSDSLRGATGTVTEQVTGDGGEVKLDDGGFNPYFQARSHGEEIPEGTEVMVLDPGGGNVVTVTALDGGMDAIDRELAAERASQEDREAETEDA